MPGGSRSDGLATLWRRLNGEQRVAAIAALLLIVSTFGPFSFVEAAIILVALGVLALLRARAEGREFHLPFGDGAVIAAAGAWAGLLIVIRLFDRSLGQNLLAVLCATLLAAAGMRERAKRPMDDLPEGWARDSDWFSREQPERPLRERRQPADEAPGKPLDREAATEDLRSQEPEEPPTQRLPPEHG